MIGVVQAETTTPDVVVSIRPLYGVTAQLLEGITEPQLLIQNDVSPHHFHMTPSQALALRNADLVVYVSDDFEGFISSHLVGHQSFAMAKSVHSSLMPVRDHHHHHSSHQHHDHHHGHFDNHIWLSPAIMKQGAKELALKLKQLMPKHAEQIERNLGKFHAQVEQIHSVKRSRVIHYIAHHDALQYLEKSANLHLVGIVTPDADYGISGKHLHHLEHEIEENSPDCMLIENNFDARQIMNLADKWQIPLVSIDVLGLDVPLSTSHYADMLNAIHTQLLACE